MNYPPGLFNEDCHAFLDEGGALAKKTTPAKKVPAKSAKPTPEDRPEEAAPQVDPNTLAPAGNDKTSPAHTAVAAIEAPGSR